MLAIQAHCHAGNIQTPKVGIPMNAKVVVIFLSTNESQVNITAEQRAVFAMQSHSNKALGQPGAVLFDVKSILPLGAADGRL